MDIKINGNDRRSRKTLEAATRIRINQDIRFLYINKNILIINYKNFT